MSLLSNWLAKKGISSTEELSQDELSVYNSYKRILAGEELTVEKIKEFCVSQVKIIEDRFAGRGKHTDDEWLKACLHVYLNIIKCIDSKEGERKAIEDHLNQLLTA